MQYTKTRAAWIAIMGADYTEVDVVETSDRRVLVDQPTRDTMIVALIRSGILADDDLADAVAFILGTSPSGDPIGYTAFDMTERWGGWDQYEQMRVDPEAERLAGGSW